MNEYDAQKAKEGLETIAQRAYEAYGMATGGKNYQGLPMPEWQNLPETVQLAWRAAVTCALEYSVNLYDMAVGVVTGRIKPKMP